MVQTLMDWMLVLGAVCLQEVEWNKNREIKDEKETLKWKCSKIFKEREKERKTEREREEEREVERERKKERKRKREWERG